MKCANCGRKLFVHEGIHCPSCLDRLAKPKNKISPWVVHGLAALAGFVIGALIGRL
jgi:DNA-directed RNA polymerase subunit RPC12/RpoP